MAVPYTFGTATASIPLSNLDSNFATTITLGNTAIQLGNTVTTLNNMTLANATVSSVSTAITVAQGGTGLTSTPANGALDIGNGTGFTRTTLTAGSGISITNGAGSISIAASGGTATSITNGTSNVSIATSGGNVVVATNGNTAVTYDTSQNATFAGYINAPNTFGFKNRIINGQMQIAQRATSGTSGNAVPTTAPTYPSVDRFYAYATGATVTVAQVAGSGANKNNLQVTGAASVTAVGIGQRIEQLNSYDLAGSTATLSVNISNSLLTTVTWTASYATSADTWSAKTQIATGTFTVTSTLTNYNAQITIPSAATTGIEILFTVGAQTGGTWVIGNVQLEKGSIATSFDVRSYGTELALCQRYCFVPSSDTSGTAYNTTTFYSQLKFPVVMRASPSSTYSAASGYNVFSNNTGAAPSAVATDTAFTDGILIKATGTYVTGSGGFFRQGTTIYSAEL